MYGSFIEGAAERIRSRTRGATKSAAMDALVTFDQFAVATRRAFGGEKEASIRTVTDREIHWSDLPPDVRDAFRRQEPARAVAGDVYAEPGSPAPNKTTTSLSAPVQPAQRMRFAIAVGSTLAAFLVSLWLILFLASRWNLSLSDIGVLAGVLGAAAGVAAVVITISMMSISRGR